jgi:hypothetical protein
VNVPGISFWDKVAECNSSPISRRKIKAPLFSCLMSCSLPSAIDVSSGFLIYRSNDCAECGLSQF